MKKIIFISIIISAFVLLKAEAQSPVVAPLQKTTIMLSGGIIHTGTGDVIDDGLISFTKGKITYTGKASDFKGDRSGAEVIDAKGKHI